VGDPFEEALRWAESNGLYPLISLYLNKDLAKRIAKSVSPSENVKFAEFAYYAYPEEEVILTFVQGNWVPPKAFLREGRLRLAFFVRPYEELIKAIEAKEEDDVMVRAVNDRLSLEKKRVFYMDFRAVNEISQGSAFKVLGHTLLSSLKIAIIANNVVPGKNRVRLSVKGDEVKFEILEGRLKREEVEAGLFLTKSQAETLKKDVKIIDPNDVREAIITKLS